MKQLKQVRLSTRAHCNLRKSQPVRTPATADQSSWLLIKSNVEAAKKHNGSLKNVQVDGSYDYYHIEHSSKCVSISNPRIDAEELKK